MSIVYSTPKESVRKQAGQDNSIWGNIMTHQRLNVEEYCCIGGLKPKGPTCDDWVGRVCLFATMVYCCYRAANPRLLKSSAYLFCKGGHLEVGQCDHGACVTTVQGADKCAVL